MEQRPTGRATKSTVAAWAIWDWAGQPFNSVMLTFVFGPYIAGAVAADKETGQAALSGAQTIAGIIVAILAPMVGVWADRVRDRRLVLWLSNLVVIAAVAACWFVEPQQRYLALGAGLLALGTVFQEIGSVFYFGMLPGLTTKQTIGRLSGLGWGLGYLSGVVCLVVVVFGFVGEDNLLGLSTANGLNFRAIALFCAAWMLVFSIPMLLWGPVAEPSRHTDRFNPLTAYVEVGRQILDLWRRARSTLQFLIASAVYRDGLAAVFSLAGVLATTAYGFSADEVIYFGLAANVIAGIGAWVLGQADDRLGPKPVIVGSLVIMLIAGTVIVLVPSKLVFWVGGLVISSLVGAVQSASRSLLGRVAPPEHVNTIFGLYQTIGRAASFIAPGLIWIFTVTLGVRLGIVGILLTLALGLVLVLFVRIPGVTTRSR